MGDLVVGEGCDAGEAVEVVRRDAGVGGGADEDGVGGVECGVEAFEVVEDEEECFDGGGEVEGCGEADVAARAGFEGVEEFDAAGSGEPEGERGDVDVVFFGDRGERCLWLGEVGDDARGECVGGCEVER